MNSGLKQVFNYGLMIGLSLLLCACKTVPPRTPTAGTDIYNTLETGAGEDRVLDIQEKAAKARAFRMGNALLPPLKVEQPVSKHKSGRRFNVSANAVPASDFFMSLVADTPYNMLIQPNISGTITLKLKNVTIDEALEAVRDLYGYDYQRTRTGYEILPGTMKTQIFTVNYLDINRSGSSRTQLVSTDLAQSNSNSNNGNTGSNTSNPNQNNNGSKGLRSTGSGSTVTTKSDYNFWKQLKETLETLVGNKEGRWIVINPQASTVMVRAYPKELHQVAEYLDHIQKNLQRQVIIEAKILEIQLNDEYQAGIDWKALGLSQNGTANAFLPDETTNGFLAFSGSMDNRNFSTLINLLQSQGNVQVLSSPHISTVNNQEAVIKVGADQYFVTGYNSNVTPTGNTNTTSQSVNLAPFFSGITLDVTPQISSGGDIILYIHPSVSTVTNQNTTIQLSSGGSSANPNSNLTLPLAYSTIRETDSVVRAKSGQIIVVGGLMQHSTTEQVYGAPGLSKLPFAGAVARNTNQMSKKSELIILLKPIVVDNKVWPKQLENSANRVHRLNRGFHVGSLPEVFGNQAEANP